MNIKTVDTKEIDKKVEKAEKVPAPVVQKPETTPQPKEFEAP